MEQTILTSEQRVALDALAKNFSLAKCFYLSGGTALAEFYLHHRYSDDLDFFTGKKEFPQLAVEAFVGELKDLLKAQRLDYRRLYDRRIFFLILNSGELKIEFSSYPFHQLEQTHIEQGIQIDSLHDIATNKLMALMDRIEPKDFVDLYFLMREQLFTIETLTKNVEQKFKLHLEPVTLGSEFAKVRHIIALPLMIKSLTIDELKSFFMDRSRELGTQIF